jgi:hypothetical protein
MSDVEEPLAGRGECGIVRIIFEYASSYATG